MIEQSAIDFALPGEWWHVPVADDAARRLAIRRIAQESLGRQDDRAQLRADLRSRLDSAASAAEAVAGHDIYFLRELSPGVTAPLSMVVAWPDLPLVPSRLAGGGIAARSFRETLRHADQVGETEVIDANPRYGVVREVRLKGNPDLVPDRIEDVANLTIIYWMFNSDSPATLTITFTTALARFREPLLALTDSIVGSVNWREDGERPRIVRIPID